VSGLALLLVSIVFCRRMLGLPIPLTVIRRLAMLLAFAIPVLGYFLFAELLTVLYAREPAALRVFDEMMFGPYALVFWGNLLFGLMAPLVILAAILLEVPRRALVVGAAAIPVIAAAAAAVTGAGTPPAVGALVAATLGFVPSAWLAYLLVAAAFAAVVLLGTAAPLALDTRVAIASALVVLGVLAERWNIVVPPLVGFAHLPYPHGSYVPTGTEVLLAVGVYAIGGLLFAAAARLLPLVEAD
jgi:Ni/Fe-hydrogenase subunit HybB-like protein